MQDRIEMTKKFIWILNSIYIGHETVEKYASLHAR